MFLGTINFVQTTTERYKFMVPKKKFLVPKNIPDMRFCLDDYREYKFMVPKNIPDINLWFPESKCVRP